MRLAALTLALAGCHATTPAPVAAGLTLHVTVAPAPTTSDVAIASVALHLAQLRAVSDRSAVDTRAAATDIDLALGDEKEVTLANAPPGLYSAVNALLGSSSDTGLELQAVWNSARVHAMITSAAFDVRCDDPVALDPGGRARLSLQIDPTGWFDGMDLGAATSDPDDNGIVISADDNRPLADAMRANVVASFTLDCAPE